MPSITHVYGYKILLFILNYYEVVSKTLAASKAHEKTIDQPEVCPLPPSSHRIQQK
jgi:hypothetical protein